jgi:hypothetical protein
MHMLELDEETVARESFIDVRMVVDWAAAARVPINEILAAKLQSPPCAWLWHTSFCGSTLLARMLHLAPHATCLREPLALRRLSDAREAGLNTGPALAAVIALLSRPWHPDGRVLVKPTHAALNIAVDIMAASPPSRALVLTSSLEDFVISHLKKTPQTLEQVPVLALRALRAGGLRARLPRPALEPPDILAASALQWAAQRDLVANLVRAFGEERIRIVGFEELQQRPADVAVASQRWLGLGLPEPALRRQAEDLADRHAKVPGRRYGTAERRAESRLLTDLYRQDIARTLAWAKRMLLPFLEPEAIDESFARLRIDIQPDGSGSQ